MPIKYYKPTSPGRRGMSVSTFEEITRTSPEKSLLRPLANGVPVQLHRLLNGRQKFRR